MSATPTPDEVLIQTLRALNKHNGNQTHAARDLGISRGCLQDRVRQAARRAITMTTIPAPAAAPAHAVTEVEMLREQVGELRSALRSANSAKIDDEFVKAKIIGLTNSNIEVPEWVVRDPLTSSHSGTPTLFASDWHWGEVVSPSQINGVNEYSMPIARARARRLIEITTALLKQHMVHPDYPGIVFALGGDMVSGDIHEELSETNDAPIMPALIDLFGVLIWCVSSLADEFGQVFVPCVTGNHGRNTKKPRAKGRNFTNFDWLLYNLLSKHFEHDGRVKFLIPDGSDAHWTLHGHRYCLTHGDQFRGGDGMIGPLGPITRGDHKKRSRNMQIDLGYDTLLMGHWHQLMMLARFIVNGSLKGYDEYAASNNFGFEIPQQALWLTHPEKGITFSMPVHLVDPNRGKQGKDWLTWSK